MHSANQDLLDVGGAAGPGDQYHRTGRLRGIRQDREEFIEAGQNARPRHDRDVRRREQRNHAGFLGT